MGLNFLCKSSRNRLSVEKLPDVIYFCVYLEIVTFNLRKLYMMSVLLLQEYSNYTLEPLVCLIALLMIEVADLKLLRDRWQVALIVSILKIHSWDLRKTCYQARNFHLIYSEDWKAELRADSAICIIRMIIIHSTFPNYIFFIKSSTHTIVQISICPFSIVNKINKNLSFIKSINKFKNGCNTWHVQCCLKDS